MVGTDADCILVADVGGTNTRLAVATADGLRASGITSVPNARYDSFDAVVAEYLGSQSPMTPSACCIAIAGPVTSGRARLTNRDWRFDRAALSARLGSAKVHLINDLAALGYALPGLLDNQINPLIAGHVPARNDQSLVVGIGTGFNICLTKPGQGSMPVVLQAELGHSSLPSTLADPLAEVLGGRTRLPATVEALFSGRGLSALHSMISSVGAKSAQQILAAYEAGTDPLAQRTVDFAAELLGRYAREMVCFYLPLGGIVFAGSVARGILGSGAHQRFLAGFNAPDHLVQDVTGISVGLIVDDAAALTGCLRYLRGNMSA